MDIPFFIVNPASASGKTEQYWAVIQNKLRIREMEYEYYITRAPYEATLHTRHALDNGYSCIVAVGGDGTLNETMNGFFHKGALINPDACLGMIPCGSGCDFARSMGLSRDFDHSLQTLKERRIIRIDIGKATYVNQYHSREERYFVNSAGFGLDGEIAARVNHHSKTMGGFLSFLYGTLAGILLYRNKKAAITIDGELVYTGGITSVMAANGQYIGSGMQAAPEAMVDDGLLDVIIIEAMGKPDMIFSLRRIYKGTHLSHPRVRHYRGKHILANTVEQIALQLDGEQPGYLEAEITIMPAMLNMIV